jgi:hypothetical protein
MFFGTLRTSELPVNDQQTVHVKKKGRRKKKGGSAEALEGDVLDSGSWM